MRCQSMLIATLAVALTMAIGLQLRPTVVLGHSMTPTLRSGGCYLLDTGYYRHHRLQRGDIVVFRHRGETCTKRIYALPGQHLLLLRYDDGVGNEIVEPWQEPALHRLEQSGWIKATWGESDNNRRAKFYSLTPAGRKYLEQEQANWKRLSTAIGLVLEAS